MNPAQVELQAAQYSLEPKLYRASELQVEPKLLSNQKRSAQLNYTPKLSFFWLFFGEAKVHFSRIFPF